MSWRTRTPIGDPPTIFQADAILFDSFPPLLLRCTSGLSPGLVAEHLSHLCLVWNGWFRKNADSARCCRFRKSRQKRASDLDLIYVWIPKLFLGLTGYRI